MKAQTDVVEMATPGVLSDLCQLVKARLSFLVLLTTLAGFLAASAGNGGIDFALLAAALAGTALAAAGASALNQWWERDLDARMRRTYDRPLPAGRMHSADGLLLGVLFSAAGIAILALFANWLTAGLAALTIGTYLFLYTPLKTLSTLNTLVGAVPGALPPLIGWTAASGNIGMEGILLFSVLWFWQLPHFLAISWIYRDDYLRAGFVMLSSQDESGVLSARQSLVYSFYLTCVSVLPIFFGMVQMWFLIPSLLLGGGFILFSARFLKSCNKPSARALFLWSLLYLPAYLAIYLVAKP